MSLLDWIFPPRCAGCGAPGVAWCAACDASLTPQVWRVWPGVPLIAAGRLDGPWQRAIHEFKYRPRPQLAGSLAAPLIRAARAARLPLDAIAFVPLHETRERARGFNQAERLCRVIAPALGCGLAPGLTRVHATLPQVRLDEAARRANLDGAFRWEGPLPVGRLGLLDDVVTTGATLEAAAAAVQQAGGRVSAALALAVRGGARARAPQTLAAPGVTFPDSPVL